MYRCVWFEFVGYGIGIHRRPAPCLGIISTDTTLYTGAVAVTVCLHTTVHVPNCSGSFVTATKPL